MIRVGDVLRHKYIKTASYQVYEIGDDIVRCIVTHTKSGLSHYGSYTKQQAKDFFITRSRHFKTGGNI